MVSHSNVSCNHTTSSFATHLQVKGIASFIDSSHPGGTYQLTHLSARPRCVLRQVAHEQEGLGRNPHLVQVSRQTSEHQLHETRSGHFLALFLHTRRRHCTVLARAQYHLQSAAEINIQPGLKNEHMTDSRVCSTE